ncbi:NAD(P)H-dependent oxidoreductase [Streptomyces sp. TRM49041]|uniref:flavodoxin family protein n=1 Tax=Streptomyces sp. TRM49041 TaxID=2603216 RepID=UPI0011F0151E|nr:NAD(P)H-dependent oxidoreductase [Streptomyces sp. TRM49041]
MAGGERKFLFLLASTRTGGNTEQLARRAAGGLGDGTHPQPEGNARRLLDATLEATDVVIASPLYWYSVCTPAKLYLDHWTGWMRVPGLDFRARTAGKTLWGVTALAGDDRSVADPLIGALRNTATYMDMHGVAAAPRLKNRHEPSTWAGSGLRAGRVPRPPRHVR